jgi:peptidoglycan/LPS O-acetylase OafA/YrhL
MRKIQYLDGLRGLAAFIVVLNHFVLAFYPALFSGTDLHTHLAQGREFFLSGTMFNLLYNGDFAVCIFFVLSGFVLSHKFFLQKRHEILVESAVKRYVRLAIPVAFSVILAYVLMKFSLFYNQQAATISGSNWLEGFWKFVPNFLDALNQIFFGAFFSKVFEYNATLWTIAFEFAGSFLIFGFLALFGKMKNRSIAYAIAMILFFQTYYLAFILGMMLSDILAHKNTIIAQFDKYKIFRTLLLLAGLLLGSYPSGREVDGTMYAYVYSSWFENTAVLFHVMGAFFVILVLLESKRMQKIFSLRYLLFLGEISFSMYLLHFIVLGSLSSFIFYLLAPYLAYSYAVGVSFFISIAFIFVLSYWMSLTIDRRAVDLSKLFYRTVCRKK